MVRGCVWCISFYFVELLQCSQRADNSKIKAWLQYSFKCNTVQPEALQVEDIKVLHKLFSVSEVIPERPKKSSFFCLCNLDVLENAGENLLVEHQISENIYDLL